MKNKTNLYLAPWFQEQVLLVKKIKEQGFLKQISPKTYPLDPGSGKNSSQIWIPDPGGKKAPDPRSGSATLAARWETEPELYYS
jgi:hypothetical protein